MNTPYFLWDYKITNEQVKHILQGKNEVEKRWLIARIITHARFEDIWQYLTINDIVHALPKLQLKPSVQDAWKRALTVWGYHVQTQK